MGVSIDAAPARRRGGALRFHHAPSPPPMSSRRWRDRPPTPNLRVTASLGRPPPAPRQSCFSLPRRCWASESGGRGGGAAGGDLAPAGSGVTSGWRRCVVELGETAPRCQASPAACCLLLFPRRTTGRNDGWDRLGDDDPVVSRVAPAPPRR